MAELKLEKPADDERKAHEQWFDSFMSRVSQWFVMNTRWITVAFAFGLAFALHLDSVALLKQLTSDGETRTKLQAMSASLLEQTPGTVTTVEKYYTDTLKELIRGNAAKFNDNVTEAGVSTVASRSDAVIWIGTNARPAEKDGLVKTYSAEVDKKLAESIDRSIDRAKSLQSSLASAGIALPPAGHTFSDSVDPRSSHFFGILASVLFLSLGAPFWFNLLKNFTSLTSAVTKSDEAAPAPTTRTRGLEETASARLPPLPKGEAAVTTVGAARRWANTSTSW